MLRLKEEICKVLAEQLPLSREQVEPLLETPPEPEMGEIAFPCFALAKEFKKNPKDIAAELAKDISGRSEKYWARVENRGPYLNFFVNYSKLGREVMEELVSGSYLTKWCSRGSNQVVVIDYSAPNIAKPFGIGHLRSTVIGNSLYRIYRAMGYKPVGINHLGDWGTQFGKLIAAYSRWGDKKALEQDPVNYLYGLYVDFHREADGNEHLEQEGREWFRKLEEGNEDAVKLWDAFCDFSLEEFKKIYHMLDIEFDHYLGESFYNEQLDRVVEYAWQKGIAKESEGAIVVDLEEYGLPPCILKKKDGATLYITRDLAAAIYRYQEFEFSQMLYVVGAEQTLHFQQLFKVLELMGFAWAENCVHVPFGLIRFKDGKMSTREGNIILLKEVIDKAISLAFQTIQGKNPDLKDKEKVAEAVGIGAIKFGDLYHDRIKDVEFEWDRVLDFSGETAPYVQYAHARLCSILRRARDLNGSRVCSIDISEAAMLLEKEEEKTLVKHLALFADTVIKAQKNQKPSILARYLVDVSREFNRFYHSCSVLGEEGNLKEARLRLLEAARPVLREGLQMLGIKAPEEM